MSKGVIKAAVLILVFFGSVLIFGNMMNYANEDLTTEMTEAKLPVISLFHNGTQINELHGYITQMDAAYMRDAITPVENDRILPIIIRTYHMAVSGISYEIRSLDAKRLIADAEVEHYTETKGQISADLTIQNLIEKNTEYLLLIKLSCGTQTIYYYTRIMESEGSHVEECVEFTLNYNDTTFNPETVGTLATYMEKMTEDNTTLHFTSLHSSLKQIGWADLAVERLTDPVPSIKEITDTYNVIVLEYAIASVNEQGESEYFNVEEYYRIRYTESRTYLLNFERTVEQIFRGENVNIHENKIDLGIRSADIEYKANEAGNSVAFVQQGALWCFHQDANTLAKVFSFRGYEGIDDRENYGEHDIRIMRVDETGSIDFLVYGYMNRGIHEGQVGVAVYHYDSASNTNEEEAFIPSAQSFEVMRAEMGQLMYVNDAGELFLMVGGSIYGIKLDTREVNELVKNLDDGRFVVSESNCFVAWTKEETDAAIHILNLSDGTKSEISASGEEVLKPLGFMKEDFVYGIADRNRILNDAAGNEIFPMHQVCIADLTQKQPKTLKTYEKNDYYVSDIRIEDYTMYLERIVFNGITYVAADEDMIMNREGEGARLVFADTREDGDKQTVWQIVLPNESVQKAQKLLTPKETLLEEDRSVALASEETMHRYYVYVKGDVVCMTNQVEDAIHAANENMGVVLNSDMAYVWKRSRKSAQTQVMNPDDEEADKTPGSVARCINAVLQNEGININAAAMIEGGETPKSILNNTMKEATVFDLSGCDVEEVLYYVSCGTPVFAMSGTNEALLIVGYDANTIIVYEPVRGIYRKNVDQAREDFKNAGNIYLAYTTI